MKEDARDLFKRKGVKKYSNKILGKVERKKVFFYNACFNASQRNTWDKHVHVIIDSYLTYVETISGLAWNRYREGT
jgi:hypothetical protein